VSRPNSEFLTICDDEKAENGDGSEASTEEEKLHLDMVKVFLNSVMGFTPNHIMNVRGEIADEVVVLIDSRATHIFISNQVIDQLGMKLVDIGCYGLMMGTGKMETFRGVCRGVVLSVKGI